MGGQKELVEKNNDGWLKMNYDNKILFKFLCRNTFFFRRCYKAEKLRKAQKLLL